MCVRHDAEALRGGARAAALPTQEAVLHARKTGDDKKAQIAASKKKKLEDRAGIEKNDKGHRFRINRRAPAGTPTGRLPCPWQERERSLSRLALELRCL